MICYITFSFQGVLLFDCFFTIRHVEDGRLMADPEAGEFWGFFGGFAPLPKKAASDEDKTIASHPTKLLW